MLEEPDGVGLRQRQHLLVIEADQPAAALLDDLTDQRRLADLSGALNCHDARVLERFEDTRPDTALELVMVS